MDRHPDTLPPLPVGLQEMSDRELLLRIVVRQEYLLTRLTLLEDKLGELPCTASGKFGCNEEGSRVQGNGGRPSG